ncbi:hypothetical protein D3C73_1595590 [compost metagenome]
MAALLHRAILASGYSLQLSEQSVPSFADEKDISEYAKKAVEALKQAKVLGADANGSYVPKSSVNRAEAAGLIYNVLQTVNN